MKEHPLIILSRRYPQLLLPVRNGMKDTEQYKDAVLRGRFEEGIPEFSLSDRDTFGTACTPCGDAEILTLYERADFEHAVRCLAYRCEEAEIPKSMGASTISGLINWEKLGPHMADDDDFKAFTSDKSNYLDTLIVLSSGNYSAVSCEDMGLPQDEWTEKSITIRKFHELTHFVSRKMFRENMNALRDEVLADMNGIISAFGYYDTDAAKRFFGIEGDTYREGGRLQNYIGDGMVDDAMKKALEYIELFSMYLINNEKKDIFETLTDIESERIGL